MKREIPPGFVAQPDGSFSKPRTAAQINLPQCETFHPSVPSRPVMGIPITEQPESELHNAIISHCKANGWIYFHGSMAHKAMRTVGEPDFTLLLPAGRVLFVECKTRTGKLSPEQLGLSLWAERLGHKIHVVRSMEEFKALL